MQKVKIVATLGPASASPEIIRRLIEAGLDVARLNFSHGTHEDHRQIYEIVRQEAEQAGRYVGILADLCGPKIRVGEVEGGGVEIVPGQPLVVTTEQVVGNQQRISTSYESLPRDIDPGDRILIDDGLLELKVLEVKGQDVHCEVVVGGLLKNHKGMNIPGTVLSTPALTDKDRVDLAFARELGVDFFALSFVRDPQDVAQVGVKGGQWFVHQKNPWLAHDSTPNGYPLHFTTR